MKEDAELKQFRDLMPPPDHWDEGFGIKAMIGGVFVGMIMTPASMYMDLVVGGPGVPITGVTADGTRIPLIVDDLWALA